MYIWPVSYQRRAVAMAGGRNVAYTYVSVNARMNIGKYLTVKVAEKIVMLLEISHANLKYVC